MSEEKEFLLGFLIGSISILRDKNIQFTEKSRNILADRIMELVIAYEKEKRENVKLRLQDIPLIEGELKAYKDRVNELKQELEKEKQEIEKIIERLEAKPYTAYTLYGDILHESDEIAEMLKQVLEKE